MSTLIIVVLITALILFVPLFYYNGFVSRRNRADQAFSTIDVMLQKRCALVPNLVATVGEYMRHEAETLTRIAQLRARAVDTGSDPGERLTANNELGHRLHGLMLQVENYPQLKADQNFLNLQYGLNEVEGQLAASRRAFNATVTEYNTSIDMFPGSLFAGLFSFARRPLLEASEEERETPDVGRLFKA